AVVLLRLGEAALSKAGAFERLADPLDLDHVDADLHDGGACSNQSGNWASELTTTSGMTAVDSSCSGRTLPGRASAVRMPKSWAPRTSASMSSVTSQVSSGSAPSASSAAAKYAGLGLPSTVASTPVAYSSPATKAPPSSIGPRLVCHQRFLCRQ